MRLVGWFRELKRRKVVQVTGVYLVFAWGASLGLAELLPTFDVPLWLVRGSIVGLFLMTPVAAILAWYFELSMHGVARDPADIAAESRTALAETHIAADPCICVRWQQMGQTKVSYLSEEFTLGRDPGCAVVVENPLASREHAKVVREQNLWVLIDLESSNGTTLDGQIVTRQPLHAKHTVSLGGGEPIELEVVS